MSELKYDDATPRERIEWCDIRWFNATDRELPWALLIGDSITKGYSEPAVEILEGKVNVGRLATSKCVGDPSLLKELDYALGEYEYAVVHFNNGLHGWAYSEDDYRRNLPEFYDRIRQKAPKSKLVWAQSTPVRSRDDVSKFKPEMNDRVIARNQIAAEFFQKQNVHINDLYALTENRPDLYGPDGVHFHEEGRRFMAETVAGVILDILA